jgi:hypothetical protein
MFQNMATWAWGLFVQVQPTDVLMPRHNFLNPRGFIVASSAVYVKEYIISLTANKFRLQQFQPTFSQTTDLLIEIIRMELKKISQLPYRISSVLPMLVSVSDATDGIAKLSTTV